VTKKQSLVVDYFRLLNLFSPSKRWKIAKIFSNKHILLFEKKRKYFPINIFCIHAQLIKLNSPKAEINAGEETKFATMRSTQTCLFRHEHAYSYMGKAAHKHMHTHWCIQDTHTRTHTHTMTCISCGPAFISFLFRTHFSLLVMSACGFLLFTFWPSQLFVYQF